MKKRRQTRIKRKRMRTGRNKNRNKDRNKNRNGIKKQKNQNWMNPSSKIYNKINKVSEMVRVFCKPLDLYLAAHFPSLKQIEKQINTIEVSHSRCLWCQKEMEECFDARWIFFADQSLCQECQDKIFKKNKPDRIKIHQVLKQKGWTQRRKSSKERSILINSIFDRIYLCQTKKNQDHFLCLKRQKIFNPCMNSSHF